MDWLLTDWNWLRLILLISAICGLFIWLKNRWFQNDKKKIFFYIIFSIVTLGFGFCLILLYEVTKYFIRIYKEWKKENEDHDDQQIRNKYKDK
tara:strand:+ start:1337 stop:1615 length:279 start_codon:yes stop_codon:yes gene_type:complete